MKNIFILVQNNGYSYDDYSEWNAGIFHTIGEAVVFHSSHLPVMYDGKEVHCAQIEEWNFEGKVKCHSIDWKGDLE